MNFHISLLLTAQCTIFENLSAVSIILGASGSGTDAIGESFKMLLALSLPSANPAMIPGMVLVATLVVGEDK